MNMNERIYLLTGAAGFLGSNICLQLLEKGCKVRALIPKTAARLRKRQLAAVCSAGIGCFAQARHPPQRTDPADRRRIPSHELSPSLHRLGLRL